MDAYLRTVWDRIRSGWVLPPGINTTDPWEAVVHVQVQKNGHVSNVTLARSSGNAYFDRSVIRAIQKADPLPPLPRELGMIIWNGDPFPFPGGHKVKGKGKTWLLLGLVLTVAFVTVAGGRVYLDIESPSFQRVPIAISPFPNLSPSGNTAFGPKITEGLSSLLALTGFFSLIPPAAFLDKSARQPDFAQWVAVGAEYLVAGSYLTSGTNTVTELRLYDVAKGEQILSSRYPGIDADGVTRKMARDILHTLSGDGGVFLTRLAYIGRIGRATEVCTVRFEGKDRKVLTKTKSLNFSPRWSHNGRYLAFTSYREHGTVLVICDTAQGTTRVITSYPGLNLPGSWSRDDRSLLVTLTMDDNEEICQLDVMTGHLKRLTHNHDIDVSPTCPLMEKPSPLSLTAPVRPRSSSWIAMEPTYEG